MMGISVGLYVLILCGFAIVILLKMANHIGICVCAKRDNDREVAIIKTLWGHIYYTESVNNKGADKVMDAKLYAYKKQYKKPNLFGRMCEQWWASRIKQNIKQYGKCFICVNRPSYYQPSPSSQESSTKINNTSINKAELRIKICNTFLCWQLEPFGPDLRQQAHNSRERELLNSLLKLLEE